MLTNEEMRKKVMRRVWGVYALRYLMRPFIRVSILAIATVAIVGSVSVASVAQNMANKGGNIQELLHFAVSAFLRTDFLVQGAFLIVLLVVIASVIDLVRPLQRHPSLV